MSPSEFISEPQMSAEPQAGRNVIPIWLIIVTFLLLYWAATYFDAHGGWFSQEVYPPFKSVAEVAFFQPPPSDPTISLGEAKYNMTCGTCHQPTGLGAAGTFPPLAGSEWVNEPNPARLIRIALDGAQGPITVKGQQWNLVMSVNGKMLGMSDEDLARVLSYIRQAWGNKAPRVKPEEVQQVRQEVASRNVQWTAEELNRVPVK